MRLAIIAVLCVVCLGSTRLHAQPFRSLRTLNRMMVKTIGEGAGRSAAFATLLNRLEQSPAIVYIDYDHWLETGLGGTTRLITAAGQWRYIKVAICPRLSSNQQIAMIAHELNHALEIAEASPIHDKASFSAFYRSAGTKVFCRSECYETPAAVTVQRQVERELLAGKHREHAAQSVATTSYQRAGIVTLEE